MLCFAFFLSAVPSGSGTELLLQVILLPSPSAAASPPQWSRLGCLPAPGCFPGWSCSRFPVTQAGKLQDERSVLQVKRANSLWGNLGHSGWATETMAGAVVEREWYWANWDHKPPAGQKFTLELQALNQGIFTPNRAGQLFIPILGGD